MVVVYSKFELIVPKIEIEELVRKYPQLEKNVIQNKVVGEDLNDRESDNSRRKSKKRKIQYDFSTIDGQYDITEISVREYFGVPNYSLDRTKLCPRIPNRMEYLRIVEECLMEAEEVRTEFENGCEIKGDEEKCGENTKSGKERWIVDVGTGSSMVYPIIGIGMNDNNRFIATEINPSSFSHCRTILEDDERMKSRIILQRIESQTEKLLPLELHPNVHIRYTVCNPPFYESKKQLESKEELKARGKPNALVSDDSEMYYHKGGEVGFVMRIIDESVETSRIPQYQHCWYTAQIGIHDHVRELESYLKEKSIPKVFQTAIDFFTKRWVLAWNFDEDLRLPLSYIRPRQGWPNSYPRRDDLLAEGLDRELALVRVEFPQFQYQVVKIRGSSNENKLYVACNEAVWIRRVRRLLINSEARSGSSEGDVASAGATTKTDNTIKKNSAKAPIFNKSVVVRIILKYENELNVEVAFHEGYDSAETVANSMRSLAGRLLCSS